MRIEVIHVHHTFGKSTLHYTKYATQPVTLCLFLLISRLAEYIITRNANIHSEEKKTKFIENLKDIHLPSYQIMMQLVI